MPFRSVLPTEQSSVAGMPPPEPPGIDRKKVLSEKIKLALNELKSEICITADLKTRTDGVRKRIDQLEAVKPHLLEAQSKFSHFIEECSPERREEERSASRTTAARSQTAALPPSSSSSVAAIGAAGRIKVGGGSGRQKPTAATHNFPNVSSFFSYPERDEQGFLVHKGRSSKRTNYAINYAGKPILGQCEAIINRQRMKRAEEEYNTRMDNAVASAAAACASSSPSSSAAAAAGGPQQQQQAQSGSKKVTATTSGRSNSCLPPSTSARSQSDATAFNLPPPPPKIGGHRAAVGMSRTAEMPVHLMDAAGKQSIVPFSDASHKYMSSRRTRFYTDYTGKRIAVDPCNVPGKQDFFIGGC